MTASSSVEPVQVSAVREIKMPYRGETLTARLTTYERGVPFYSWQLTNGGSGGTRADRFTPSTLEEYAEQVTEQLDVLEITRAARARTRKMLERCL